MKWNNVNSELIPFPMSDLFHRWSSIDIIKLITYTKEQPIVILPQSIKSRILEHLNTETVELGGLLLGSVISTDNLNDGLIAIEINDIVESRDCVSTSVSLTMNPDVWKSASKNCDNRKFVVGWYHSHPNLGAFFSGTDRKTQKDFFNHSYSLGLVIDPIRNEEKLFIGIDSKEVTEDYIRYEL